MRRARWLLAISATLVLAPSVAWAYLDPGTGSYFLQTAAAVLFGGLLAIKLFWKQIKGLFRRGRGEKTKGLSGEG